MNVVRELRELYDNASVAPVIGMMQGALLALSCYGWYSFARWACQ